MKYPLQRYLFEKIFLLSSDDVRHKLLKMLDLGECITREQNNITIMGSNTTLIEIPYPRLRMLPEKETTSIVINDSSAEYAVIGNNSLVGYGNIQCGRSNISTVIGPPVPRVSNIFEAYEWNGQRTIRGNCLISLTNSRDLILSGSDIEVEQHQYSSLERVNIIGSKIKIIIEPFTIVKDINIIGNSLTIVFSNKQIHQNQTIIENSKRLVF